MLKKTIFKGMVLWNTAHCLHKNISAVSSDDLFGGLYDDYTGE